MAETPTLPHVEAPAGDGLDSFSLDVIPSGGGYRAVVRRGGHVAWSCPHVHFTEHSARNCPTASQFLQHEHGSGVVV